MTPAVFTRRGRCVVCPPYMRRPTIAWRMDGIALRALHVHDADQNRNHEGQMSSRRTGQLASAHELEGVAEPAGSPATMPPKMISEMPLPMPRSVICSPSHMTSTVPAVR